MSHTAVFTEMVSGSRQTGLKLMLADKARAEEVWRMILPHIKKDLAQNMIAPIYCEKVIECAELVSDISMTLQLKSCYKRKKKSLKL